MRRCTFAVATLTFVLLPAFSATVAHAQPAQKSTESSRTVFVGSGDDAGARSWSPPKTRPQSVLEVDCWVTDVINPTARANHNDSALLDAGAGGFIDVTVVNLEALFDWNAPKAAVSKTRKPSEADLVLFLDGKEVKNLHPRRAKAEDARPRVIQLRGENVRVMEHVLHFEFDRAPNKAWPRGVDFPDPPDSWDALPRTVGVGFPGGASIRSQSLDPKDADNTPVLVNLVPRWHATDDNVPEYALTLDSWVGAFVVDNKDVAEGQLTYGLGDNITLSLYNADAYIQWAQSKNRAKASERTIGNLVLFIEGRPIPDLHPTVSREPLDDLAHGKAGRMIVPIHRLQFKLRRTLESNDVWGGLLNRPSLYRNVAVSVGFSDLAPVISNIGADLAPMRLVVIPINSWSVIGAALIVASLGLFFFLAATSDLIRDPGLPAKPDGSKPFSLARTQMAFWFFLVFSTYFFIFVITGDKDTIPAGILGLISVSAATAVGSALVDASARSDTSRAEVHPSQPISSRTKEIRRLEDTEKAARDALAGLTGDPLAAKEEELKNIQSAIQYLRRPRWQNFFHDLLAESGTVSFHQFQICVWTLTLGIIFIKEVWDKLAMPEFSATLVGLMGISSGTYVALKERPGSKT